MTLNFPHHSYFSMNEKKTRFRTVSYKIFWSIFLFPFCVCGQMTSENSPSSSFNLEEFRHKTLLLINQFRQEHNLHSLASNPALDKISQQWAEHIAQEKKLVHRSLSSLKEIVQEEGWGSINENLHYSTEGLDPEETVRAWQKSPGHRKNLLDESIQIAGIGAAENGRTGYVVFNGASVISRENSSSARLPLFFKKLFQGKKEPAEDPEEN
ncbi:hypothetical protein A7Q10_07005 [Methylacidiphilum caldifontis]|uniref:SCP domain-containing protein n=2 Tax=Methylacidiphilum caldifontis TaxID=2795386 RepID=A0A4Y8PDI2_9BACT|nr:hypothetical protein A7Q10_07005 [Methylacidiphilum caldifontis]